MANSLTLQPRTLALVEHLLQQGATRAASRLAAVQLTVDAHDPTPYSVPSELIRTVEDDEAAAAFAAAMQAAVASGATLALDAEWRPDTGPSNNPPALVQVAVADADGGEEAVVADATAVWLLDAERLRGSAAALRLAFGALDAALSSEAVRVLGFGLQADLNKLALLGASSALGGAAPLSTATRVVDLRDLAAAAEASGGGGTASGGGSLVNNGGVGLAARLARWAGVTLDKACQRSDWARRPLSPAQVAYAAADASCLFALHFALVTHAAALGGAGEHASGRRAEVTLRASASGAAVAIMARSAALDEEAVVVAAETPPAAGTWTERAAAAAAAAEEEAAVAQEDAAGAVEVAEDAEEAALLEDLSVEMGVERATLEEGRGEALETVRAAAAAASYTSAGGGGGGDEPGRSARCEVVGRSSLAAELSRLGGTPEDVEATTPAQAFAALEATTEVNAICLILAASPSSSSANGGSKGGGGGGGGGGSGRGGGGANGALLTLPAAVPVLLLLPAGQRVDLKWLALVLGVRRRALRLATGAECVVRFGATPGSVPPLPLRRHVAVLCHPALASVAALWGSTADPAFRLAVRHPIRALPRLAAASSAAVNGGAVNGGAVNGGAVSVGEPSPLGPVADAAALAAAASALVSAASLGAAAASAGFSTTAVAAATTTTADAAATTTTEGPRPPFAWLPDPALLHSSLDDAIAAHGAAYAQEFFVEGGSISDGDDDAAAAAAEGCAVDGEEEESDSKAPTPQATPPTEAALEASGGMAQAAEWAKMAILHCKWPMRQFGRSSALARSHSDVNAQGAQGTVAEH